MKTTVPISPNSENDISNIILIFCADIFDPYPGAAKKHSHSGAVPTLEIASASALSDMVDIDDIYIYLNIDNINPFIGAKR
jgi:hypothetical protein